MPLRRMTTTVAQETLPQLARLKATSGAGVTGQELLSTIGAYIPTEVTTAYVAAAGGIATLAPPLEGRIKFALAIAVALVSGFLTWVIGHRKAVAKAKESNVPLPSPVATLARGWYEIGAAVVAFFAWATAVSPSWYVWGNNVAYGPALLVFIVSVLIGGGATLLNRDVST